MGRKYEVSHVLPAPFLITKGDQSGDGDVIIHICRDITYDKTTKAHTSFYHTSCGKNIDYADVIKRRDLDHAILEDSHSYIRLCLRCGTVEDHIGVFNAHDAYVAEKEATEERERKVEEAERERKFSEMIAVFEGEALSLSEALTDGEFLSQKFYTFERGGVTYRINIEIKRVSE